MMLFLPFLMLLTQAQADAGAESPVSHERALSDRAELTHVQPGSLLVLRREIRIRAGDAGYFRQLDRPIRGTAYLRSSSCLVTVKDMPVNRVRVIEPQALEIIEVNPQSVSPTGAAAELRTRTASGQEVVFNCSGFDYQRMPHAVIEAGARVGDLRVVFDWRPYLLGQTLEELPEIRI